MEEDRHALYQISANYMQSSSRSLQTTTTVVLTIINNISFLQLPQPVLRQLRALLPQFVDTATATQYGPREALRSAQLAATNQDIDMANAIVIVHTSLYSQWGGVSICTFMWLLSGHAVVLAIGMYRYQ